MTNSIKLLPGGLLFSKKWFINLNHISAIVELDEEPGWCVFTSDGVRIFKFNKFDMENFEKMIEEFYSGETKAAIGPSIADIIRNRGDK